MKKIKGMAPINRTVPILFKEANPYNVMWAQSQQPDDSEIWMTFKTDTQYPGEGLKQFKVYFKGGKALTITKL